MELDIILLNFKEKLNTVSYYEFEYRIVLNGPGYGEVEYRTTNRDKLIKKVCETMMHKEDSNGSRLVQVQSRVAKRYGAEIDGILVFLVENLPDDDFIAFFATRTIQDCIAFKYNCQGSEAPLSEFNGKGEADIVNDMIKVEKEIIKAAHAFEYIKDTNTSGKSMKQTVINKPFGDRQLAAVAAFICAAIGFVYACYAFYKGQFTSNTIETIGFPGYSCNIDSTILSVIALFCSLIVLFAGLLYKKVKAQKKLKENPGRGNANLSERERRLP
ncbi:hypothetical protein [Paenibacillus plantiphilus]|nr:hypothetical protein [Paenibacillus plantiphilus]